MGVKDLKTGLSSRDTDINNIFTKGIEFVVHSLARDVCITNINNLFLIFLNYNIRKVEHRRARDYKKGNTSLLRFVDKLHLRGS